MSLPYKALNPAGDMVSILVTPDGKLVTDLAPLPAEVQPYSIASLRVDAQGNLEIVE